MADARFSEYDAWVKLDGDLAVIGITDYAQAQLSDIVYVGLPKIGRRIEQGAAMSQIESVLSVIDFIAPVSGEVAEINEDLEFEPETMNFDPMGKGWFFKLRLSDAKQLDGLMDEAAYQRLVEQRQQ